VLETQGDLKNADDRRDEAKPLWEEALKTVQEAPDGCFAADPETEPDEEQRQHLNETEQRLLDKLKDPEPDSGGGGGGGQGGGHGEGQGQGQGQGQGDGQGQGEGQGRGQGQGEGQGQGQGQGESQGQGQGSPGDPAPDTVGADRIATDSGSVTHELNPQQGDPDDVLKRLLEDSDASGVDHE